MQKIKQFIESGEGKDVLVVLIVVLVSLSSFGLGRMSKNEENAGLAITYQKQPAAALTAESFLQENPNLSTEVAASTAKKFFASRIGKKYYPNGCSAGKSIKQANRIYFDTSDQAEKAGYTLSGSCN